MESRHCIPSFRPIHSDNGCRRMLLRRPPGDSGFCTNQPSLPKAGITPLMLVSLPLPLPLKPLKGRLPLSIKSFAC